MVTEVVCPPGRFPVSKETPATPPGLKSPVLLSLVTVCAVPSRFFTVITVKNLDGTAHTVTSESNTGDFSPGGVAGVSFDTGNLPGGQTTSVTIPGTAPSGTVIPYYCVVHGNM